MIKILNIYNIKPGSVYRYIDENSFGEIIDLTFLVIEKNNNLTLKVKYLIDKSNDGTDLTGRIRYTQFYNLVNNPPTEFYELDDDDILLLLGELL